MSLRPSANWRASTGRDSLRSATLGGSHETSCSCSRASRWAEPSPIRLATTEPAEKKLAGAALTSFMKKCEKDSATACDTQATDKKLSGAAKTSFTKKCVKDATGT